MMKNKRKALIGAVVAVIAVALVVTVLFQTGLVRVVKADRGDLPYYGWEAAPGIHVKPGSLEEEYQRGDGVVVVRLNGKPELYVDKKALTPGSAEEKIAMKTGLAGASEDRYYLIQAKVIDIVDNRSLPCRVGDEIMLHEKMIWMQSDPIYQHVQVDPEQDYLLLLAYDPAENVYYYNSRAAYFVRGGAVFATNPEPALDQYSGLRVADIRKKLNRVKKADQIALQGK